MSQQSGNWMRTRCASALHFAAGPCDREGQKGKRKEKKREKERNLIYPCARPSFGPFDFRVLAVPGACIISNLLALPSRFLLFLPQLSTLSLPLPNPPSLNCPLFTTE